MISRVIELVDSLGWNPMRSGYLMKDFYNVALVVILIYKGGGWVVDE